MGYKVKLVDKKDPIEQLEASKLSIKDLFHDLLNETKGFKYQITLKVTLKKASQMEKLNLLLFISIQQQKIQLWEIDKSIQEILYRIDNWINEASGWIVELIESQCINISTYRPLSRSSYRPLSPAELRKSKKVLINIKSNDQKCFLWFHIRHINPVKTHPERVRQTDKELANDLDYNGVEFPVREKDFSQIEKKSNICINVYCYENKLTFPIYISDQKFENTIDFLLVTNENKSHYVYINNFNRFMFNKTKNKNKKYFCKSFFTLF